MAKYLTRRCMWLHVITLVLVSSFVLAAWWQYDCARAGNGLSWAYTFEWPAFAVYVTYMWWKMIHDQRTGIDRLWTARQHAAADAFGTPLHQIPGWALDKTLSRKVIAASLDAPESPALSMGHTEPYLPPALGDGGRLEQSITARTQGVEVEVDDHRGSVIDADVIDVKVHVDENLMAYNRYLSDLSRKDVPKHWGRRKGARDGAVPEDSAEHRVALPAPDQGSS